MKIGDKAQLKLSFGMIFSIILIIFFIAFAFFGIKRFLEIQGVAQVEKFKSDLQEDVNKMWKSTQGSQEVEYDIQRNIEGVCFFNSQNGNLFFIPDKHGIEEIENIDINKIIGNSNQFCIQTNNGKIAMTIKKNYGESLVIITK